ncbi:MAG: hypothetical protein WCO00_03260 [Rhodospirillaceae bacterium]
MHASHTPGPWRLAGADIRGAGHESSSAAYETVATLAPITRNRVTAEGVATPYRDHETEKANAHLIAAAPEVLAALETLQLAVAQAVDRGLLHEAPLDPRTALDAQEWMRSQLGDATRHARAAIAHAWGRRSS